MIFETIIIIYLFNCLVSNYQYFAAAFQFFGIISYRNLATNEKDQKELLTCTNFLFTTSHLRIALLMVVHNVAHENTMGCSSCFSRELKSQERFH